MKLKDAKFSKALIPLIAEAKRALLVSGYNFVRRPQEIFNMLKMLRPDLMPGFYEFGYRYCDPRQCNSLFLINSL